MASLYALGLNHQTAPLAIRERVVFHVERLREALTEIKHGLAREAAIVSTCNRTELYVAGDDSGAGAPQLSQWLARYHRFEPDGLRPYLYTLPREQAVRHVFRVASGLDSMVLGEPQILGQLKEAARAAESAGTMGTLLHKLFQRSFAVAKEVRSTTQVGAASVSMAAAARLAARIFPSLKDQHVLFIGAGEMIELCATHFAAQGPARITVANRTLERAEKVGQFMHWMQVRQNVPLIRALRGRADEARREELERALRALGRGEEPAKVLESLSQGLVNKLMHAPTQALNETAGEEQRALAETLARLYRLQ